MATKTTLGPATSTQVGEIVAIDVPGEGPYGALFEPDSDGHAAVIRAWERLPDGKFGPIQKHGGVRIGDVLFCINTTILDKMPHRDVTAIIGDRNILRKTFKFMTATEYYRRKAFAGASVGTAPSSKMFLSVVRRGRTNMETSSHFAEYEIACQLRLSSLRVEKDRVFRWSVWHRFSDFEALDGELRRALGWQMEGITFPPSHTFTFNKLAYEFVEQRRDELNNYWQQVISLDRITEFHKHHSSEALKVFLQVDLVMTGNLQGMEILAPDTPSTEDGDGVSSPASQESKRPSRRQSLRGSRKALSSAKRTSIRTTPTLTDADPYTPTHTSAPTTPTSTIPTYTPAPPPPPVSSPAAVSRGRNPNPNPNPNPPPPPVPSPAAVSRATPTPNPVTTNPARSALLSSIAALRKD